MASEAHVIRCAARSFCWFPILASLCCGAGCKATTRAPAPLSSKTQAALRAAEALAQTSDPARDAELARLAAADPEPLVRARAAELLATVDDAEGRARRVESLRVAAGDRDVVVRRAVAASLWNVFTSEKGTFENPADECAAPYVGYAKARDELLAKLARDGDEAVRVGALDSLGELVMEPGCWLRLDVMIAAARDPSHLVRRASIRALKEIVFSLPRAHADFAKVWLMLELLAKDRDEPLKKNALRTLDSLRDAPF